MSMLMRCMGVLADNTKGIVWMGFKLAHFLTIWTGPYELSDVASHVLPFKIVIFQSTHGLIDATMPAGGIVETSDDALALLWYC